MWHSLLLGVMVVAVSVAAQGAAPPGEGTAELATSTATSAVPYDSKIHAVGDVWVGVKNDGTFARSVQFVYDPSGVRHSYGNEVTFVYPANSHRRHSFIGGLWIGGLVGLDTLASGAVNANSLARLGFRPVSLIRTETDLQRGYERFACALSDTVSGRGWPDPWPLRVQIQQVSHAFASPPYDRFVLLEYTIRNISGMTIRRPHVGLFMDCDVYHDSLPYQGEEGYADDLSGYLSSEGIAYSIDNNGDPNGDGAWSGTSIISAIGMAPVFFDPLPRCTSFNWWATDFGRSEWGPSKAGARSNSYPSLGSLPFTAEDLYATMANREQDYDQLSAALDFTLDGWNPPAHHSIARNIAFGEDSRWTLAYGFGDLPPGGKLRIVMALAAGDSVHHDPGAFSQLFRPDHPHAFRNQLDFSDLIRNVRAARWAWGHDFDLWGAAPAKITATPIADRIVRCEWPPAPFYHVRGYRLYRRAHDGGDWMLLREFGPNQWTWDDVEVEPGVVYDYAVSSLQGLSDEGPKSHPVTAEPGFPPGVPTLSVETTPAVVGINWSLPEPAEGFSEYRYLNIYRSTKPSVWEDLPYLRVSVTENPWASGIARASPVTPMEAGAPGARRRYGFSTFDLLDDSVTSGVIYYYRASITNALGFEGKLSDTVIAIPQSLDRKGIVLLNTAKQDASLIDPDSVVSFYSPWAQEQGFDTLEVARRTDSWDMRAPLTVLSRYQCVVLAEESWYDDFPRDPFARILDLYLSNGGRCVFALRNHHRRGAYVGYGILPAHDLIRRYAGVRTTRPESWAGRYGPLDTSFVYIPGVVRFRAAISRDPEYPDLEGDSLEGWSVQGINPWLVRRYVSGAGYVPCVGALDTIEAGTDVLYWYKSAYDTTFWDSMPVAVRRITDSSGAVLFNFPLSLMKDRELARRALTQAVADLGIDTSHAGLREENLSVQIIHWLYSSSTAPPQPGWDVNRDGVIDLRDVVRAAATRR